jgi:hypothetical protein
VVEVEAQLRRSLDVLHTVFSGLLLCPCLTPWRHVAAIAPIAGRRSPPARSLQASKELLLLQCRQPQITRHTTDCDKHMHHHARQTLHHMNRAIEPSTQVYGRSANTYRVAAVTQQKAAAVRSEASLGGGGRCSTTRAKGAVKYLQHAQQGGRCVCWGRGRLSKLDDVSVCAVSAALYLPQPYQPQVCRG